MISRIIATGFLLSVFNICLAAEGFNPREYPKRSVTCDAFHRNGGKGEHTATSITMSYVDINPDAERTLLFVHGWPGLWSTWSNQIMHFKDKYHLVVPNLRGFGDSSHPGDVQASGTHGDLVGDLVCVLQDAKVTKAVCIGHDWGAQLCYEAARMRPDLFEGVVGATIPYLPAAGDGPTSVEALSKALPKLTYNIYFQENTDGAIAELNRDIRRTVRSIFRNRASPPPDRFLRSKTSFLKAYDHLDEVPPVPYFTPEEEDYHVEHFSEQGFDHTLQFYTQENRQRSWEFSNQQGNLTIPKPALAIYPIHDPVADWPLIALIVGTKKYLPYLTTRVLPTAHWIHLEKPVEFNAIVEDWLNNLDIKLLEVRVDEKKKELHALQKELKDAKKRRGTKGDL